MSKVKQKQELRKLFPCHKQIYIVTSHILTGYNNKKKKDNPKRLHIPHNRFKLWFKRTKFKYDCSKNAVFENICRQIHVRKVGINFNALNYQLSPTM